MASYIGKVQIGAAGDQILVGSTLYGVCASDATAAAKVVTLPDFDAVMHGITVQVRFENGNSVTTGVTLKVGGTNAFPVAGNCVCSADDVIAFTLSQTGSGTVWYANHSIKVETGSTDGTIKIAGEEVAVAGLGSAAYTDSTAYATAAQGQKADDAMPKSGGTFTGPVLMSESTTDSSAALAVATKDYVVAKTAGLSGLTGAMHFRGETPNSDGSGHPIVPNSTDSFNNYDSGDVLLVGDQEYVYSKSTTAAASQWILLGDEGSYALKSSTDVVGSASAWNAGTLPTLGDAIDADDITNWDAGSASDATVNQGVLRLTNSTVPTLAYTAKTVPNVTNVGTLPSITISDKTVVVPDNTGGGN